MGNVYDSFYSSKIDGNVYGCLKWYALAILEVCGEIIVEKENQKCVKQVNFSDCGIATLLHMSIIMDKGHCDMRGSHNIFTYFRNVYASKLDVAFEQQPSNEN